MSKQSELMNTIQMSDFALTEAGLFLDSHPENASALDYYKHYKAVRDAAAADYTTNYGPITQQDYNGGAWKWVDQPFPWLRAANG